MKSNEAQLKETNKFVVFHLRDTVRNFGSLMQAFDHIPEEIRPVKVNEFMTKFCKDEETRKIYLEAGRKNCILLANEFSRQKLLAFLERNNL